MYFELCERPGGPLHYFLIYGVLVSVLASITKSSCTFLSFFCVPVRLQNGYFIVGNKVNFTHREGCFLIQQQEVDLFFTSLLFNWTFFSIKRVGSYGYALFGIFNARA